MWWAREVEPLEERLGHSTIAITLGIYSHVSPTLDSDAARTVAALMLPS
jgi:integrase